MEVIFLGTGSSLGIPVLGCSCAVCRSDDPKNRRSRSSVYFRQGVTGLLVDTGPDLRAQSLREGILDLDAVLLTHFHADHVAGIDDLRNFNRMLKRVIPVYSNALTIEEVQQRFSYCFYPPDDFWEKPTLEAREIQGDLQFGDLRVTPVPILHGKLEILGYRVNDVAYLTDVKEIPEASLELLQDLSVLVLSCLRFAPHPTHVNFDEAMALVERIGPRQCYLTHMTHDIDPHTLAPRLPAHVTLAYDGLRLQV